MILFGYGYWGKILSKIFEDKINVICDLTFQHNHSTNSSMLFTSSLEEAIKNNKGSKIAIIATNASSHFEISKKLILLGYDLWIEKPATLNSNDLNELIKIQEKHKNIVFVDYPYCYDKNMFKVGNFLDSQPLIYRSMRLAPGIKRNDTSLILDLAIHDLSILNLLYPNLQHISTSLYKINDDHIILEIEFQNKFKVIIECSWSFPIKKRLIILKTKDNFLVHDSHKNNKLTVYDNNHFKVSEFFNYEETLYNAKHHFLDCIKTRNQPNTNLIFTKKIYEWIKNV